MNQILSILVLCWMTGSNLYAQPTNLWQAQNPFDTSSLVQDADIIDERLKLIGQERTIGMDTTTGIISIVGKLSTEDKGVFSVLLSDENIEISEVGDRSTFLNEAPIHEQIFYFLDTNNAIIHHAPRFPSHVVGECTASDMSQVNRELQSELGGMIFQEWELTWTRADNGFYHLIVMKCNANTWSINDHVLSTSMGQNADNPSLYIEFDAKGTELFANWTESNLDRVLVLHMNDQVIMAPRVRDRIKAGKLEISTLSHERIKLISALLKTERLSNSYSELTE